MRRNHQYQFAAGVISLLLTILIMLLSELLTGPGLGRDLVQKVAPGIGDLITLLLLVHITRWARRRNDGNGPAGQEKSTDSHGD